MLISFYILYHMTSLPKTPWNSDELNISSSAMNRSTWKNKAEVLDSLISPNAKKINQIAFDFTKKRHVSLTELIQITPARETDTIEESASEHSELKLEYYWMFSERLTKQINQNWYQSASTYISIDSVDINTDGRLVLDGIVEEQWVQIPAEEDLWEVHYTFDVSVIENFLP